MSKIYTFGDSFTVCKEIKPGFIFYENYTKGRTIPWPEKFAKTYNKELVNVSFQGASFQKILTALIVNISRIERNSLIIISGTNSVRDSIPSKELHNIDPLFDYHGSWDRKVFEDKLNSRYTDRTGINLLSRAFLDYMVSVKIPLESEYKWYYDNLIYLILEFLKKVLNIEYIFWNWDSIYKNQKYETIADVTDNSIPDSHLSYKGNLTLYKTLIKAYENKNNLIGFKNTEDYFNLSKFKVFNLN